jgi:N-acetylneuraminic acid mutarotase
MQSTADSMQDTAPAVPRRAISGHTLAIALGIVALLLVAAAGLLMWMDWPASESPPSRPTADEPSSTPSFPLINTTERWRELAPLPDARSGFALAGLRSDGSQYLYVIGGSAGADVSSEVWRYTIAQDTWVERTAMPIAVSDVQAATIGSKIYVPGGRLASGEITSTLAVYDPRLDSWETRAPLPEPRSGYALAAFEGKLYLFGGWDGSSYRAEVWQYNPDQDTWIERTPMPTARAFTGAALLAERIHVLGGEAESGPLATHEQYTPADEDNPGSAWKTLTPMPVSISNMAVAASGERLFAISGQDASHPLIVYNNRLDAWETQELPLAPRADLRVQEFDNALYIIGGRSSAGDQNQVFRYQAVYTIVFPFD